MNLEQLRGYFRGIPLIAKTYRGLRTATGGTVLIGLWLLRPLVTVRVGFLDYDRIGHLASNTEYWLRTVYANRRRGEIFVLLSTTKPANFQLVAMFQRVIRIILNDRLHAIMLAAHKQWPSWSLWLSLRSTGTHDYALWDNSRKSLTFTSDEMKRGGRLLQDMGIPDGSSFVCFAIRDKTYLDSHAKGVSWSYHDYRDADVENCRLMAEWLAARGIWVIRMGAAVGKPFRSENPRIIDYARTYRSDFGDIFLLGNCKFFVGDTAGIFWPAAILGTPVLLTNLAPITHLIPLSHSMVMLKKYRQRSDGELMPYRKVVEAGIDGFVRTQEYEGTGVELVENSPEEILGAAQEMNARVDGTWISTPEDEELHARFWTVFPEGHPSHGCPVRVPIDFLRRNQTLLS